MIKEIDGLTIKYDKEDDVFLRRDNWGLRWGNKKVPYLIRKKDGVSFHRLILNAPRDKEVDHIDHNTLNNKKINLRLCTRSQNLMNRGKTKQNTSGCKGVYRQSNTKKWRAKIQVEGKEIHIGYFYTRSEAYEAYKEAAILLHGEFARW